MEGWVFQSLSGPGANPLQNQQKGFLLRVAGGTVDPDTSGGLSDSSSQFENPPPERFNLQLTPGGPL